MAPMSLSSTKLPQPAKDRTSSQRGFTLIELPVAIVATTLLFAAFLPAVQDVRHKESRRRAVENTKLIATAMLQFYDANGSYPGGFEPLLPYLEVGLWSDIVDGRPVDGSIHKIKVVDSQTISLYTEIDNPMRVTQTLAVTLDANAFAAYRQSGDLPTIVEKNDPAAVKLNADRLKQINDAGVQTVMCVGDYSEAEAQEKIEEAWRDYRTRQAAWNLLDQNDDQSVTIDEVYGNAWEGAFGGHPECVTNLKDYTLTLLNFDSDEPNYAVPVQAKASLQAVLLARLAQQVSDLRLADTSTRNNYLQLNRSVDHILTSLRTAQPEDAVLYVTQFQQNLSALVRAGVVSQNLGESTLDTASFFQVSLIAQLLARTDDTWPHPTTIQLHVDAAATFHDGITGAENDPFPDLFTALAYAEQQELPAVELLVQPGKYVGSLEITRDTRIIGQVNETPTFNALGGIANQPEIVGRLNNTGPYFVHVYNIDFNKSDGTLGALRVNNPFAVTYLDKVGFYAPVGFAIHQTGGQFRCNSLTVFGVTPYSADIGVGVQFDGAAKVELKGVLMQYIRGAALLLSDADTEVHATQMTIADTSANPFDLARVKEEFRGNPDELSDTLQLGTSAIDVRNGAYLQGDHLEMTHNERIGLFIHDQGRAVVNNCRISYTSPVTQLPVGLNGVNVFVRDGSSLEMSSYTLSYAELGVSLAGDISVDLSGVAGTQNVISHCLVAVGLGEGLPADFDTERVFDSVDFENNTANLRTVTLPIPAAIELE